MGVISAKDLDAQMRSGVRAADIPTHVGGTQGAMQPLFLPQAGDAPLIEQGHGKRGTPVYTDQELPQQGFYGSGTVVVVNDAPPLPPMPAPPAAEVPPVPAAALPPVPASTIAALARMGLHKAKPS